MVVNFEDNSTAVGTTATEWLWNFGDGTAGEVTQNAVHTYASAGTYTVTLTAKDANGVESTVSKEIILTVTEAISITADFTFTSEGLIINFNGTSTEVGTTVAEWLWNFGDGTVEAVTQNAVHTYASEGTYTVRLTVKDANGIENTVSKEIILTVTEAISITADFTFISEGLIINFNGTSTDVGTTVTEWLWNFGDGTADAVTQNTVHTYASEGTYTVRLTVKDANGVENTVSKVIDVKIPKLFASSTTNSTFGILASGKVYAWGNNAYGKLGVNTGAEESVPTPVEVIALNDKNIVMIAVGNSHTLALSESGKVYAWGRNSSGQLGLGDEDDRDTPTEIIILGDKNIISIVAGQNHTLALSKSGKVYAWGRNESGQLGLGDIKSRSTPEEITTLSGIKTIEAGQDYTLAIDEVGKAYSWGLNSRGQLGLGNKDNKNIPTEITTLSGKIIEAVAGGNVHTFAIDDIGKVYAWGYNSSGQLGLGNDDNKNTPVEVPKLSNIKTVVAGNSHTSAVDSAGKVYTWGGNDSGQLGHGNSGISTKKATPTGVEALKGKNIKTVVGGSQYTLAVDESGKIYAWGSNSYGQLGIGDNTDNPTPAEISIIK